MITFSQLAPRVQDNRRIINLAQQWRILIVLVGDNTAIKIANALQLASKIDRLFPTNNGLGCLWSNTIYAKQFTNRRTQNSRSIAEMVHQVTDSDGADILDQVQCQQSLTGIHRCILTPCLVVDKLQLKRYGTSALRMALSMTFSAPGCTQHQSPRFPSFSSQCFSVGM